MLGPDALTSGMSLDDWNRYVVSRMYVATGRNQSETARRLEISWRRAGQWIDHALLARWAVEGGEGLERVRARGFCRSISELQPSREPLRIDVVMVEAGP